MSPKIICLALAIIIIVGLALAAARGHKMPIGICFTLIIVGALVVLAPTVFSFLLRLFGRDGGVEADNGMLGGIMVFVGIVGAIFSRRAVAGASK
jgi:ABC-type multidrug transport system permease subunit